MSKQKSNVFDIKKAINSLRSAPKIPDAISAATVKPRRGRPRGSKKAPIKVRVPAIVPDFPDIPGLDTEKTIIGKGIVALNKALFEQTIHESERLGKIRSILSSLEVGLFDQKSIDNLDPIQKIRVFESLRKDSEVTVNFLERMQRNSLQVMMVFEIYKKLLETIKPEEELPGLPPDIDKTKVMEVRGALLDFMSKSTG